MPSNKVGLAEALIAGLIKRYFTLDIEPNDRCDRCGQLIDSSAGRLCADCLERALAELVTLQQAAEMRAYVRAVHDAAMANDEFGDAVWHAAVIARDDFAKALVAQITAKTKDIGL